MANTNKKAWHKEIPKRWDRAIFNRQVPSSVNTGTRLLMTLMQKDNRGLSEEEILDAVHDNPLFYAGISLIASQVASTDIYPVVEGEIDRGHDVAQKLRHPNRFHTEYTFKWIITAYLMALGTAYIYQMDGGSLLPVPPKDVTHLGGLKYHVRLYGNTPKKAVLGENFVKLRLPDLREPYISGSGYGTACASELDIAKAASDHESAVLHSGARPDSIVTIEGATDEQLKKVEEDWNRSHQGANNSGKTGFTNGEGLSIQTLNTSFSDLGFIDLRKYSADVIRQSLGIPPELLGQVENSNRATIEAAFYVFAKGTLEPKLAQIISALNKDLIPLITDDKSVILEHEDVVPEDKEFKKDMMSTFPQAYTINEARELSGDRPVAGGDRPLEGEQELVIEDEQAPTPERTISKRSEIPLNGKADDLILQDLHYDLQNFRKQKLNSNEVA